MSTCMKLKKYPAPVIENYGREITFPVSCIYNGGVIIDDEWYDGVEVPAPIVPKGYKFKDIVVGLESNAVPPWATYLLVKE